MVKFSVLLAVAVAFVALMVTHSSAQVFLSEPAISTYGVGLLPSTSTYSQQTSAQSHNLFASSASARSQIHNNGALLGLGPVLYY